MESRAELRMLGEPALLVGGRAVDIGHTRQRAVLIALAAEANRPVPIGELVDRVWGEQLPRRPREALYGYLSRLRAVLPADSISRGPGGYLLKIEPETVDLHRFARLVAAAKDSPDDARALESLDSALALWRGRALADADTPWLRSLRDDLDRRRLAAELDRNDLRLALGRHDDVLLAEIADTALNERHAGQVMLALYRSGRAAEALTRFQELRERLAEELGADPGPELRRLHSRILNADPALAGPPRAVGSVPRQLPAPSPSFQGRDRELAELTGLSRLGTVVLSAGGGVGKTWLAVHWAYQRLAEFPDGQLYVNLRGFDPVEQPTAPAAVVRGFLDALGVRASAVPSDPEAQAGLFRGLAAERRLLILLDNARDTAQVLPLLPGGGSCTVLVTSRHTLGGLVTTHGARSLPLGFLDDTEACALLTAQLGDRRVTAEPEAVTEILRHCAGLPLALGIAAARAATQPGFPLSVLAGELREASLDALDTGEISADLRAVFDASYRTLTPEAATLFRLAALVPGRDLALNPAAALLDVSAPRARKVLRELTSAHLLQEYQPGRYLTHDLVRHYAAELVSTVDDEVRRRAALTRFLDHYRYAASLAADWFAPRERFRRPEIPPRAGPVVEFTEDSQVQDWLAREHGTLIAVAEFAAANGWPEHTCHLSHTLFRYFEFSGWYEDANTVHRAAVSVAPTDLDLAKALSCLASACQRLGRYAEGLALTARGLELARRAGDLITECTLTTGRGILLGRAGDQEGAVEAFEASLELARRTGQDHLIGIALCNVGDSYRIVGRYQEAFACQQASLVIAAELDDFGLEAVIQCSLGDLHRQQGEHAEAQFHLRRGISYAQDMGNPAVEVESRNALGESLTADGHPAEAVEHYLRAERLAQEISFPHEQARAQRGLAGAYLALGDEERAQRYSDAAEAGFAALRA